ncbi:MAG TPA: GDSL-type esterase/lipase family protein [Myxococcales bacterium]|nr:GDSL-type esterase/lipase family protein [Myxococcales bacterium]
MTIFWVAALAVALSALPLPDWARPFPELLSRPKETALAALLRRSDRPPEATPGLPQTAAADDATASAEPPPPAATGPLEPSAEEGTTVASRPAGDPGPLETKAMASLGIPAVARARELEALAAQVGSRHVPIEDQCTSLTGASARGCAPALLPFFQALEADRRGHRQGPVRIIHLGDSLIASDHITDVVRERLEVRHGSGGKGFLFVDRPTQFSGRTVRTGKASEGWQLVKLTDQTKPSEVLGFSGVNFSTSGRPETVEYDVTGATFAEVFFLTQPKGGVVEVRADGTLVGRLLTRFPQAEAAFAKLRFPLGTRKLALLAKGGEVQLYGVAVETGGQGIVYDSIGIPGATAKILLRADETAFRQQLQHRNPSLVVVMLGGNEAYEYSRGWTKPEEARASFDKLVERIKGAVPGAACLLMSPLDAGTRTMGGKIALRGGTREMAKVIRDAAFDSGCAYWDIWAAMGGKGALQRWDAARLMNADLVHPKGAGGDVLGHLFDVALTAGYMRWAGPATLMSDPTGLEDATGRALNRTLMALRVLEQGHTGRVAVAQLGASHTAAHYFTDQVRKRLAERFGGAGRGYVAAGRASPRLSEGGVSRELEGPWEVPDALSGPSRSAHWGLTGVRAEGGPGAVLRTLFCTDCQDSGGRAGFQVHYLEEPGMGRLEVRLDGQVVASVPEGDQPVRRTAARVLSFEADGYALPLEVRNAGGGPVVVFGTSAEQLQPGIVWDSLGLPGATSCTLAGYDQATLGTQLQARRADLYVLFLGTNETVAERFDEEKIEGCYDTLLGTLRRAAPSAECLILGPTDRMEQQPYGWIEAPSTDKVVYLLRRVARQRGCAFWSPRAAMGGPGAIDRWLEHDPPLANPDHVHLSPEGYRLLADALANDLLAAYAGAGGTAALPPPPSGTRLAGGKATAEKEAER